MVVNKSDRPGADRAAAQLRGMLTVGAQHDRAMGDRPRPKRPDVLLASAMTGAGVPELLAALDHRDAARRSSESDPSVAYAAAHKRAEAQLAGIMADRLRTRLADPAQRAAAEEIVARVARHEQDPYSAADTLLDALAHDGAGGGAGESG